MPRADDCGGRHLTSFGLPLASRTLLERVPSRRPARNPVVGVGSVLAAQSGGRFMSWAPTESRMPAFPHEELEPGERCELVDERDRRGDPEPERGVIATQRQESTPREAPKG